MYTRYAGSMNTSSTNLKLKRESYRLLIHILKSVVCSVCCVWCCCGYSVPSNRDVRRFDPVFRRGSGGWVTQPAKESGVLAMVVLQQQIYRMQQQRTLGCHSHASAPPTRRYSIVPHTGHLVVVVVTGRYTRTPDEVFLYDPPCMRSQYEV